MKKNVFALSVATALAAMAGTANAQVPFIPPAGPNAATQLMVTPGGIGHISVAPYYTVQGNNNTLMNIVNTDTVNGKAVKVRFRGARNSDDVFDFYVFLSPGDVWRSRVYRRGEQTHLDIQDTSCTLPGRDEINETAFKTVRVFEERETEVREGYIELLTAADVVPGSALFKTIKHHPTTGAVQCDMSTLVDATVPLTTQAAAQSLGLSFPTTGLIGHWAIVDVVSKMGLSGANTAIQAARQDAATGLFYPAQGSIVIAPQTESLAPASWKTAGTAGTADPLLRERLNPMYFDFPDLSTPYVAAAWTTADPASEQANQLSASLSVSRIVNEFSTGGGANMMTDWVFSMPTRRYGVAIDYEATGASRFVSNAANDYFGPENVSLVTRDGIPHLAINLNGQYFDNNERSLTPMISPSRGQQLTGEVNVLTFNNDASNSVLGAQLSTQRVEPKLGIERIDEGWAFISMNGKTPGYGLPVVGYAALTSNGSGLGFTWPHRYVKGR